MKKIRLRPKRSVSQPNGERAADRAGDVEGGDGADLGGVRDERVRAFQHAAHGADDGDFQPVEHPADAQSAATSKA